MLPRRAALLAAFGLSAAAAPGCAPGARGGEARECACESCARWRDYVRGRGAWEGRDPHYEVLTQDFVAGLADLLQARVPAGSLVLELGAGNGRLARHLASRTGLRIVATDSGLRGLEGVNVEALDAEEALRAYGGEGRVVVVLVCWMPFGVDFTEAIRACSSVSEYVLVGDPELTGDPDSSWRAHDGWERTDFRELCQLCCTDERGADPSRSRTAVFTRRLRAAP